MGAGAAVAAAGVAVLAFSAALVHVLAGMLLVSFGSGAFLAVNGTLAEELIPAVQSAKFRGIANLAGLGAASLAGLFGPLLDLGARAGTGNGYAVLFAAVTAAFVIGALAARPGLAMRPSIGDAAPESTRS
jgi:hypothetical protein